MVAIIIVVCQGCNEGCLGVVVIGALIKFIARAFVGAVVADIIRVTARDISGTLPGISLGPLLGYYQGGCWGYLLG